MRHALALGLAVIAALFLMGCIVLPITRTETHHHHHYSTDPPEDLAALEMQAEGQTAHLTVEVTESDCDD